MKNRMINTRFWQDAYGSNLDPVEKLLFLYLLTNNYSTLSGVYEVPIKIVAVETGIDKEMVEKILRRFERDDKVVYREGWVAIKNFIKHHAEGSPKVRIGIEKSLEYAPEWAKSYIQGKGIDTLSPSASASTSTSALASKDIAASQSATATSSKKKKKREDRPMNLKEFVAWCEKSTQRHIQLIGQWADTVKPKRLTKFQWEEFMSRNFRAAKRLAVFSEDQINGAYTKVVKAHGEGWLEKYTMETLLKFI